MPVQCLWFLRNRPETSGNLWATLRNPPRDFGPGTAFGPDAIQATFSLLRSILLVRDECMFVPVRFVWNATKGNRLTPWRSEYLKWRIETFSGKKAESLRGRDVFRFVWDSKWELLDFLAWTGRLEREVRDVRTVRRKT
jgi:hypothetical protein